MPKKIYRMSLKEFKKLMVIALNEGLEELSSAAKEEESLDEVVPTLIPPERKRFEELKNKKKTGSLTDQEKREYLSLLQKDIKLKSDSAKQRTDATFGQIDKLSGSKPVEKSVDENFGEQEQTQTSGAVQQNNQVHGSAAKKLQSKMEKIPGLEQLVAAIKQKGDASVVLKDLAQQIGGDKLPADQILAKAYSLAKKEK